MPHGKFTIIVEHWCGEPITVDVTWKQWLGTRINPPEWDESHIYHDNGDHRITTCPRCGAFLDGDDRFFEAVDRAAQPEYAKSEYIPGDDIPDDSQDFLP